MSNVCAGIGRGQMEVLEDHVQARRAMHAFYMDIFKNIEGVTVFQATSESYANYWLSAIIVDESKTNGITREQLRLLFEAENIETRPLWKPMHLQPVFANSPYYGAKTAESLFEKGLCLPSGSNLTDLERDRIQKVVDDLFRN